MSLAQGGTNHTEKERAQASDIPVHRQNHLIHAALDLILGLQMCHVLSGLPVDGQDHIPDAQVGLGCFTAGRDLWHRHTQIASSIILFPSGKHINLYFTECIFQHIQDTPRTCFTLATVTKGKGVDGVDGGGGGGGGCRMVEVVVEVVEAVVVEKEGVSSTVDRMPCCRFEIISNKID